MNNLSNERLAEYANDKRMCNINDEIVSMARELLALREAGKEPKVYVTESALNRIKNGEHSVCCNIHSGRFKQFSIGLYAAPQLPAVPEGWVMVPIEATSEMLEEICLSKGWQEKALQVRYAAMIAAAPKPEVK